LLIFSFFRPSGLLPLGSWLGGFFCVWTIHALRLSKRKKAPPANCPKAEGRRGERMKNLSSLISILAIFDKSRRLVSLIASSALCAVWLDPECVGGAALLSAKCVLSARAKLLRPRTLARPLSARAELRLFSFFPILKIRIFKFLKRVVLRK
jgi:hypothetical protein